MFEVNDDFIKAAKYQDFPSPAQWNNFIYYVKRLHFSDTERALQLFRFDLESFKETKIEGE